MYLGDADEERQLEWSQFPSYLGPAHMANGTSGDDDVSVHRPYRKPWTAEEDEMVRQSVKHYGVRAWPTVAALVPGRSGKQCRERWHNHLDDAVKKEPWTIKEERKLYQLQQTFGNR